MDAIEEWTQAQGRVIELVEGLDAAAAGQAVPACPDWTVRQLLSHMIGLDADVLAGDEPDDHNNAWTQRQVDARAADDVAALVTEWRALAQPLREWMAANNTRPLGDVVIHEQDLRGALGEPGVRDTEALATLRDRFAGIVDAKIRDAGLPGIALAGSTWTTTLGDEPAAVTLEAPEYELLRMVMARRSPSQVRAWVRDGDVSPYLGLLGAFGPLPDEPVIE